MSQSERRCVVEEAMERLVSLREAAELEAQHLQVLSRRLDVLASASEARAHDEQAPGDRKVIM